MFELSSNLETRRRWLLTGSRVIVVLLAALSMARLGLAQSEVGRPMLVSRDLVGETSAGSSFDARVSDDGQRIAFSSNAALLARDDNAVSDIYLFERASDRLSRLSLRGDGEQAATPSNMPALSGDGRWLAFVAEGPMTDDEAPWGGIYLREIAGGDQRLILAASDGGRGSHFAPVIDRNGDRIAFLSTVDLDGDGTSGHPPAPFLWDRSSDSLRGVGPSDVDGRTADLALSADGAWLAFSSEASNLIPGQPAIWRQVYLADLQRGELRMVSRHSDGSPGNANSLEPTLSEDGRRVAFTSYANNLVDDDVNGVSDIFVHDVAEGRTWSVTDITPADNVYHPADSDGPSLSADGRCLAFASGMYTLEPGAPREQIYNIYVHDFDARRTRRLSRRADGSRPDRGSHSPWLAGGGSRVAFTSRAALVAEDTDELDDVYATAAGCVAEPVEVTSSPPPGHHPSATPVHHPTATTGHHPTHTPDPHGTATPVHHPTATSAHHPTGTTQGVDPHTGSLWLPYIGHGVHSDRDAR